MNIGPHDDSCPACGATGPMVPNCLAEAGTVTVPFATCDRCDDEWVAVDPREGISREQMMLYRPMGAATFHTERPAHQDLVATGQALIEEKLNGDRLLMFGGRADSQFFTRTISKQDDLPVEKTDWLPSLSWLRFEKPHILDAELVVRGRSDHTKVNSIFNCELSKSLSRQKTRGPLILVVFDILVFEGEDVREESLDQRIMYRDEVLDDIRAQFAARDRAKKGIRVFPSVRKVRTGESLQFIDDLIDDGYEGGIVKDRRSSYHSGKRPANQWMKLKQEIEVDLFITGFRAAEEVSTKSDGSTGATKYKGMVGALELSVMDITGDPLYVCKSSGFSDAFRKKVTKCKSDFIGKVVRVKGQRVTRDQHGALSIQNPRILGNSVRDDKRAEDCQYEDLSDMVIE